MKSAGEWMELETIILSYGSPAPERQILHFLPFVDVSIESLDMSASFAIHIRIRKLVGGNKVGAVAFNGDELNDING